MKYNNKIQNPKERMKELKENKILRLKRKLARESDPNYRIKQMFRKQRENLLSPEQKLKKQIRLRKGIHLDGTGDNGLSSNKVMSGTLKKSSEKAVSHIDMEDRKTNKLYKLNKKREEKGLPPLSTVPLSEASSTEFYYKDGELIVSYNNRDTTLRKFIRDSKGDLEKRKILGTLNREKEDIDFQGNLFDYIKKYYSGNDKKTDIFRLNNGRVKKVKD